MILTMLVGGRGRRCNTSTDEGEEKKNDAHLRRRFHDFQNSISTGFQQFGNQFVTLVKRSPPALSPPTTTSSLVSLNHHSATALPLVHSQQNLLAPPTRSRLSQQSDDPISTLPTPSGLARANSFQPNLSQRATRTLPGQSSASALASALASRFTKWHAPPTPPRLRSGVDLKTHRRLWEHRANRGPQLLQHM